MRVNWREIPAARNSFAVLAAACEATGWHLRPVTQPEADITCYSLNSISERRYRDEIADADCITIVGGPHATACWQDVAAYADYVVVGEGEYTLPRLLTGIEVGKVGHIPGVATRDGYEPAKSSVRLDAYPPFSEVQGYVEISRGCPFACGYCQTPQMFGHGMRHRSIDEIIRYSNRYGQARFVTPNAFAYGSDGIHPRFDKIEHLLRKLSHKIFFGTFPSEVRPSLSARSHLTLSPCTAPIQSCTLAPSRGAMPSSPGCTGAIWLMRRSGLRNSAMMPGLLRLSISLSVSRLKLMMTSGRPSPPCRRWPGRVESTSTGLSPFPVHRLPEPVRGRFFREQKKSAAILLSEEG